MLYRNLLSDALLKEDGINVKGSSLHPLADDDHQCQEQDDHAPDLHVDRDGRGGIQYFVSIPKMEEKLSQVFSCDSPTPKATKLHIGKLTKNVNKDHVQEIFAYFGKVLVELLTIQYECAFYAVNLFS